MKNAHIPEILIKFDNLLSYRQLNDKTEIGRLENEIKKGIFISDRIALNSQFGIEKAAVRYMNWINDEVVKGAKVFEIIYKTTPIGFFTLKCLAENKYDNFLAGMYVNQENFGYGFSILSKSIEEVKKQHGKSITTHISSNNIEVMRLYFQFGFVPTDVVYVMSKISKINDK
jgi:hypothetical protein